MCKYVINNLSKLFVLLEIFVHIIYSSYWWFVPESPRWLLSYARVQEAEVIIQSIAKWNKKEISPTFVFDFVEVIETIVCCNDELSLPISWVICLLTDSGLPDTWKLREMDLTIFCK